MRSKYLAVIISLVIIFHFSEQAFAWNDPPVANISVSPSAYLVGDTVNFYSNGSYDSDGYIVEYAWKFGDGNDFIIGYYMATHQYTSVGTYTAWLRVEDNDDAHGYDHCTIYVYEKSEEPIYVDKDVNTSDPCYTGEGDSWANAYQELRGAIADANGGALFYVAEGTYFPGTVQEDSFELKPFMEIQGGFPSGGGERDPVVHRTILSGDIGVPGVKTDNCYRVVQGAHGIILDGLTIRAGNQGPYFTRGGGLYCIGDAEINNCVFEDNGGTCYYGGAVCYYGNHNTQKFTNCVFSGNQAHRGGAVYRIPIGAANASTQEFINCVFTGNTAVYDGGAVYSLWQDTTFINCTFYGNEASDEIGGVYSAHSTMTITNCIFWGNTDDNGDTTTEQEQIYNDESDVTVSYSCVEGGWSGTANIDTNPQFRCSDDPDGTDGKFLTIDDGLRIETESGCVDYGNDSVDVAEDIIGIGRIDIPEVGNSTYDMGAYEVGRIVFVDANATGSNNGTSWTDAYNYLQDALSNSQAGDEIWVAEGTYYPDEETGEPNGTDDPNLSFELVEKVAIYGGFAGDEESLFERDLEKHKSILSGNIDAEDGVPAGGETIYTGNSYHVVTGADDALLDGFTITEGYIGEANIPGGAGVYCDGTSPVIRNCIITGNFAKAGSFGGGIYAAGASSPKLINCLVAGNFAQKDHCSGIYQCGRGTLELVNCTVVDNAFDGIHCDGATLNIDNSIVWHNRIDPNDNNEYPVREIVLNDAQANIYYSNIEEGKAGIDINDSNLITDLPDDNTPDPEFESWGEWTLEKYNGEVLQEGITTLTAKEQDITIYDFQKEFAHFDGPGHDEDNFIASDLNTVVGSDWYKTPELLPPGTPSRDVSSLSNVDDFKLWFTPDPDARQGGPIKTNIEIPSRYCVDAAKGIFEFNHNHFFPIENCCYEDNCTEPNCDCNNIECFGPDDSSCSRCYCELCEKYHNWFFTLQYHTKLTYVPGQSFEFEASDDLIIAINNKVVIHREGFFVDCTSFSTIELKNGFAYVSISLPECEEGMDDSDPIDLGLEPYQVYDFDLFFANRSAPYSVLRAQWTPGESEILASFSPGDYHLTDNGQTLSPCIDAADSNALPASIVYDLDGNNRFIDDSNATNTGDGEPNFLDMGAYEFGWQMPPEANDDCYIVGRNFELLVGMAEGVLANDYDDNGDEITAELVEETFYGELTFNNTDGSFTYEPPEDFYGIDDFRYRAKDSQGLYSDVATVTLNIVYLQVYAGDDNDITIESNPVQMQLSEAYVLPVGTDVSWSVELEYLCTVDFVDEPNTLNPVIEITADVNEMAEENPAEFVLLITAENEFESVSDDIKITVRKGQNFQSGPYVEAGEYEPITLPYCNYVDLKGVVEDDGLPCGQIISEWSVKEFPEGGGSVSIGDKSSLETRATFDREGRYVLELWATDTEDSNDDTAVINVNYDPNVNHPPSAFAGNDRVVILNGSQVNCELSDACAVDLDGDVLSISWTVVGPSGGASFNPEAEKPTITFTKCGFYTFTMLVDDDEASDSNDVNIEVKPSLYVEAGSNKSAALPDGSSVEIYFEDANAKKLTIPYDHLDIEWSLDVNSPNNTGVDFNSQEGLENPAFIFSEKGNFKFKLTAVDEDITETTNNSKSDIVWVSIYGANEVQEMHRNKVFVLPEFVPGLMSGSDNGRLGFLSYYPVDDNNDTIVFDEELVFSDEANEIYYNTIDMTFDRESGYLFVSCYCDAAGIGFETFGVIYVNEAAREFTFGETQLSEQFIPTSHNVAGIAFDNTKSEPKLYVLENWTGTRASHNLFVYNWDADRERLIYEKVVTLDINEDDEFSGYRRTDLAFDDKSGILYVTFGGAEEASAGVTDIVYGYDTNDWSIVRRIETDDPDNYPAFFIDIYNDGEYTYLFTANWEGSDLARTKINNDDGTVVERVKKDVGEFEYRYIFGIGVDDYTGNVWITTAGPLGGQIEGQIRVYDGLSGEWATDEPLAVYESNENELELGEWPRSIIADSTKKDFDQGSNKAVTKTASVENNELSVSPVDEYRNEITYQITYHIYYDAQNVFIEDKLTKSVDFIEASGSGKYDPVTRKVRWYLGSVSEGAMDMVEVKVRVNKDAEIGGEIVNSCKIESNSRIAYSEPVKTEVDWWARRLYVDVNAPEGGDGVSWETAYQTLQDALYTADQAGGAIEETWVAAGTYSPGDFDAFSFRMVNGVDLYGGFAGTEKSINERDFADANNETILSGLNLQGNRWNKYVVEAANNVILDGFTITGANDSGIFCNSLYTYINITIFDCNITNNYCGIYADSISVWEKLQVVDCSISDNNTGIYSHSSSPVIRGCEICFNSGNGVNLDVSPAIVENCWIYKNGDNGICTHGNTDVEIYNNTIVRNGSEQSLSYEGYGLYCPGSEYYIDVNNCIVWDNYNGQLYECRAGYSYVGDSSLEDPFVDSANDDYHLRDDFAGCIDKGNRIITETTEPNTTKGIVIAAEILAEDSNAFLEDDIIEIANDGIPRIVQSITDNTIGFEPALDSDSTEGMEVINWKITYQFANPYELLTYTSISVSNASIYNKNDVIRFEEGYFPNYDYHYRIITDVNLNDDSITFTPAIEDYTNFSSYIDCWSLADNFDIDGEQRIVRGRVDIGADEYSPVQVYAGEDKEVTISVIDGTAQIRMGDAEVIVRDDSISDLMVQWSCINKTDGFSFNGQQAALNPTLTFTEVGDYLFKLEARDDAGFLGADFVRVRVNLGMTLSSEPAEAAIGQTTVITAGDFAGQIPEKIDWHCSDGAIFNPTESYSVDDYNSEVTFANGLGIYRIKGVAYDSNDNYLGEEQIWITVNYAHIITDAGCDYEITRPDNRAYLNGSIAGAVPQFTEWIVDEELGEYVTFDEVTSSTLQSFADFAAPGLYRIGLVTRNQDSQESSIAGVDVVNIKVNPAAKGIVYAGEDVQITKPQDEAFLTGWVEGDCTDCSYEWTFDGNDNLVDVNTETLTYTRIDFNDINDDDEPEAGVYKFEFVVTDANSDEVGRDVVLVMLTDADFSPQTAQADANQQVSINSYGYAYAILTGEVSAPGDTTVKWYSSSDEVEFFGDVNEEEVIALFYSAGEYPFAFEVRDENGDVIGIDTVTVSVKSFDGREIYVDAVSSPNEISFLVDDYVVLEVNEVGEGDCDGVQWLTEAEHSELADLVEFDDAEFAYTTAEFGRPGIYTIALQLLKEDLVVGRDYVQVQVNFPENIVDAKIVVDANENKDEHCVYLIGDDVSVDLTTLVSGVGDTSVLSFEWSPAGYLNDPNIQSPTATFDEAGIYTYKVEVRYGQDFIGADSVRIIVVSDKPIVDPGSYPTVKKGQVLPLDKSKVWCMEGRTISSYLWTSTPDYWLSFNPPNGSDASSSTVLHPDVSFSSERHYWLTLKATDNEGKSGSGTVKINVKNPVVYAGRPKETVPFEALYLSDARVKSASDDLTYKWVASPNEANVFFEPSAYVLNPDVMFIEALDEPYQLTLTAYDGLEELGSDTVEITVNDYLGPDDGFVVSIDINTTPEVSGEYCGEFDVNVTAEDENLALYYLEMDGQRLRPYYIQVLRGSYDSPQKVHLFYNINTHSIDTGPHTLKATAYERSGDCATDTVDFTNTCKIYNFTVTPDCITEPEQALTFDANFVSASSWTFDIIDTDYDTNSNESQFPITVDYNDLGSPNNGTYEAELTFNQGEEYASVYFDVAVDMQADSLVAEINDMLKVYKDAWGMPLGKPIITEGLYDFYIKAYHPTFNDDVRCKVTLEGEGLYKNITPGCLDEEGYRKGHVGSESGYGLLGKLDFTSVPNGPYTLRLIVNCLNLTKTDTTEIAVSNNVKIGNLKFSQQDMVIPVAGVPISVVRTYDSFNREKEGDFGYGWTYTLANMDIQLNNETRGDADNGTTYREGDEFERDVTLTLPDGQRATFVSWLDGGINFLGEGGWELKYSAPENITAQLTPKWIHDRLLCDQVTGYNMWVLYWSDMTVYAPGYEDLSKHDVPGYELTLDDGTVYHIDRSAYETQTVTTEWFEGYERDLYEYQPYGKPYLSYISLPSGDKIVFDVDDSDKENPRTKFVKHYQAGENFYCEPNDPNYTKSIEIVRDDSRHPDFITKIFAPGDDPNLPSLKYEYDMYGNLVSVKKLVNKDANTVDEQYEITSYVYEDYGRSPVDHFVTDIEDERGLSPIQYVYDSKGRLIGTIDARGNVIEIKHNVNDDRYENFNVHHTEEVIDRLGNTTIYGYDERGRVTLEVRPDASYTKYYYEHYSFDYNDGETVYVDAEVYNSGYLDKPCVIEDSAGNSTYYQYDYKGNTTKVIDPEYNVTEYQYDENGNLTRQENKRIISFNMQQEELVYEIFSITENEYYYRNYDDGSLTLDPQDNKLTNLLAFSQILDANEEVIDKTEYVYHNKTSNISEVIKYYDPAGGPSDYDVVTSYDYDEAESGSLDQPYSVSQPHYASVQPVWTNYFKYDEKGNQLYSWYEWIDPNDTETILYVFTVNEYDGQDRVIRTWRVVDDENPYDVNDYESAVILSETAYNSTGKVDYSIDENGLLTKYEYDQAGNLVETLVYENYDSFIEQEQPLTISRTLYDEEGRAVVSVGPYDAADSNLPVGTATLYDSTGRVIETQRFSDVEIYIEDVKNIDKEVVGKKTTGWDKDELLSYEKTIYDSAGRVVLTITLDDEGYEQPTGYKYDAAGKQIAIADANDYALQKDSDDPDYAYEQDGGWYVIKQTVLDDLLDEDYIDSLDYVSTTEYEGNRRKSVTDDRGNTTSFEYDALNRVIKTIHPETVVVEGGTEAVHTYTHTGYDYLGRKVWESDPVIEQLPEDVNNSDIKIYQYDAAGRLITVVMPEVNDPENGGQPVNPVYDYYYDEHGNLIGILDAKDRLTVFKYNELGQQTAKYQPFELSEPNRVTLDVCYELSQQSPQPKAATQQYDVLGRITKSTDYKGQVTGFTYNDRGLLENEKYYVDDANYTIGNPENVIEYTYDNLGRKIEVIVDSITEQEFYYDIENRVTIIDTPQGVIGYSYNPVTGRKDFVCTPEDCSDSEIEYVYDILGRLAEVIVHKRNRQSASEVTAYYYNPAGSIEQIIYPNGNITEYSYDSLNRLKELTNWKDDNRVEAEKLSRFTYTHYADGQRASVTEVDGTIISWTYDNLNRLTVEDYDAPGTVDDYCENYEYDLCGNRKCIKDLLEQIIVEYSYNELDQLEFEDYTTGQDYTYQYNDNGSLIRKYYGGSGDPCDEYSYNLQGRLSSFTPNGGDTITYNYNTYGVLVEKQAGSSNPVSYIIDPYNPTGYPHTFKQKQAGQSDIVYILGNDAIGQATGTDSPVFYIYDGHGSVRNLANSSGSLLEDYHFGGYGQLLSRSDSPSTDYLYAGQMYDWDMDFYNNWHRWYDPYTGRFNRVDLFEGNFEDPISIHKYLYCHNNPINGLDPSGTIFISLSIRRLIAAFGVSRAIRILVGIRATYVLGEAYREEVNPKGDVKVNMWIAKKSEFKDPKEWVKEFMRRPDIVDHDLLKVYEVKRCEPDYITIGRAQVLKYIDTLIKRYPDRVYTPGLWNPIRNMYPILSLPGIKGIGVINVKAWNVGGGVIAYDTFPREEAIVWAAVAADAFQMATMAVKINLARAKMIPSLVTIKSTVGKGLF